MSSVKPDHVRHADELGRPHGYFRGLRAVIDELQVGIVDEIVEVVLAAYRDSRSIFVFGNGGSAALASHCACDLGKGTVNGSRRLRVISLADNVPLITAWANDVAFDDIYMEQLRNLLQPNDVVLAISCSGNSPNIIKALRYARDTGATTVGLTGFAGGQMKDLCDLCLVVPSDSMQLIEDLHVSISHSIFLAVKARIADGFAAKPAAAAARFFS
ncbi:MAG TPA: SIS domain-containing protein [Pyrinomonadaceae bacterium]|jgi:D-sedoheptulose 7-phosphate isomerase|nr:SIS domain-containing protein [Pyrinomonadaceae bacterium]